MHHTSVHSKVSSLLTNHSDSSILTALVQLCYHVTITHSTTIHYTLLVLSLSHHCLSLTRHAHHCFLSPTTNNLLLLYVILETAFHLLFLHRRHQLTNDPLHHPLLPPPRPSPALRKHILHALLTSFDSTQQLRNCLSGWFISKNQSENLQNRQNLSNNIPLESIHSQNILELLAGIFFSSPLHLLDQYHLDQISDDLRDIQDKIQYTFKPGKNKHIKPMNHTLEAIRAEHRPLFFYLLIESFRSLVFLIYFSLGFRRYQIHIHRTLSFEYWFHPGFSPKPTTPIVLIAGIVGLVSIPHYAIYLLFTSKRPIFLVGNSSVSLTLMKPDFELIKVKKKNSSATEKSETYLRRKILTMNEQSKCMLKMIKNHGFKLHVDGHGSGGAFLIGHSLGTTLIGHFMRHFPNSVAGTLSIDPISVLPYIPHLVRGFVYSEPKTIGEILVRVIAREIGVATVIQRHFNWFEFVIFTHLKQGHMPSSAAKKNQEMSRRIPQHYILSEQDAIVNYEQVSNYLKKSKANNVSFTTLIDTPHGGFLLFHLNQVVQLTLKLLDRPLELPQEIPKPMSLSNRHNTLRPKFDHLINQSIKLSPFLNNHHHHHLNSRNHPGPPSCLTDHYSTSLKSADNNLQLVLFNEIL